MYEPDQGLYTRHVVGIVGRKEYMGEVQVQGVSCQATGGAFLIGERSATGRPRLVPATL